MYTICKYVIYELPFSAFTVIYLNLFLSFFFFCFFFCFFFVCFFFLFVFSSPELKAQVSFSDRPSSVVRLSVRLSVNFHIFDFFSRTTGPISTKLATNHPWGEGIQFCSNEGQRLSARGDNSKKAKIH
jgi:hypothetical protein